MRGDQSLHRTPYFPLLVYRQGEGTTVDITAAPNRAKPPMSPDPALVKFTGKDHFTAAEYYAGLVLSTAPPVPHLAALARINIHFPEVTVEQVAQA